MLPTTKPLGLTSQQKKDYLESALFELYMQNPFYAGLLTEMNIKYSDQIPTCIAFDKKKQEFEIILNTQQMSMFSKLERTAVLHHEVLHFAHQHLLRATDYEKDPKLYNIAMDMSINQYIQNLPQGCIEVKQFKKNDGSPFPTFKGFELYYELLKDNQEANKDEMAKYTPETATDAHGWEEMEEGDYQKMAEEAKKLVNRTVEKTSTGYSELPDTLKDLMKELDRITEKLNYKRILKEAIKKTVCVTDRESTWNRPNKRYGVYAPGTRTGRLPNIGIFIDTSGSISHNELNDFLGILNGFLKHGAKKCSLGLWHTELYYYKPHKFRNTLDKEELQSGGTDVSAALDKINDEAPDLSIILTDGDFCPYPDKIKGSVIWIISHGGNKNHPMKHVGKTIMLDALKND